MKLNEDQYLNLLRCLSAIVDVCNDVDIRNSTIRQRSNDRSVIFDMILDEILRDPVNIPIVNLKQKLDLLKIFASGQIENQNISIDVTENSYSVYDQYTELNFKNPNRSYMDNHFLEDTDMQPIVSSLDSESLVLSCEIPYLISNRIKTVTQNFHTVAVKVCYNGSTASIISTSQAKDQVARFLDNIPLEFKIEKVESNVAALPFVIDHDGSVLFESFLKDSKDVERLESGVDKDDQIILLNRVTTEIGSIPVVIYFRSSLGGKK